MKKILVLFFSIWITACGANSFDHQNEFKNFTGPEDFVANPENAPIETLVFCPAGSTFSILSRLCIKGNEAVGPFTKSMIDTCRAKNYSFCDQPLWPLGPTKSLRGVGICPVGSTLNSQGDCVENGFIYGPFRHEFVNKCKRTHLQSDCESLRWIENIETQTSETNKKLDTYYADYPKYRAVYNDVMSWFGTTTNGCVAFLSTAMRHVNVAIPQDGKINGYGISTWTEAFEIYVRDELKWNVIADGAELLPGDVVISEDRYPGHPDHVYMFHGWHDKILSIGWVVDNQNNTINDYVHKRNVIGDQPRLQKRPYARHYRAQ